MWWSRETPWQCTVLKRRSSAAARTRQTPRCDLQHGAAHLDMRAPPTMPMDLCVSEAHLRLQPPLAVNPISLYPTQYDAHASVATHTCGWLPSLLQTATLHDPRRMTENQCGYGTFSVKQQLKQVCKSVKQIAELRVKSVYAYIRHAQRCTKRRQMRTNDCFQ